MLYSQGTDHMKFEGLPDNTMIQLFSTDGKKLQEQRSHVGEATIISFGNYPTGTYIVKIKDATYKFMKR